MTRINVIPVSELSDQHLIAEYHELPRVLKQDINIADAPEKYCLGKGHVKWARKHALYCLSRYMELLAEMEFRGFNPKYLADKELVDGFFFDCYEVMPEDIELNRQRIREKYQTKPNWYRWTKRTKPEWLN